MSNGAKTGIEEGTSREEIAFEEQLTGLAEAAAMAEDRAERMIRLGYRICGTSNAPKEPESVKPSSPSARLSVKEEMGLNITRIKVALCAIDQQIDRF